MGVDHLKGLPVAEKMPERWRNGLEYVNDYLTLPFYRDYLARTEAMYAAPREVVVLSRRTDDTDR